MSLKNKEEYNDYMKDYMLNRHHERMQKAKEKLGEKCIKCSSTANLQFDHIDPKQNYLP